MTTIRITESGVVEVQKDNAGKRWRTTLAPGDVEQAKELLSAEQMAEVKAAWTAKVVAAWQKAQAAALAAEDVA